MIECSWCGGEVLEGERAYPNRRGEVFCSPSHRSSSNRALRRLTKTDGVFRIWRGSGRASEPFYRLTYETDDSDLAHRRYRKIADNLRQGAVVLVRPNGTWVRESGPALRTRW